MVQLIVGAFGAARMRSDPHLPHSHRAQTLSFSQGKAHHTVCVPSMGRKRNDPLMKATVRQVRIMPLLSGRLCLRSVCVVSCA